VICEASDLTAGTCSPYGRSGGGSGGFTAHAHPDTDEVFLVLDGQLRIKMDAGDVQLGPGQVSVVPRSGRHQPVSADGVEVLLLEPSVTVNTGDSPSNLTAERRET
jgi:mannose-6-phosphate isomerase-like protein (cupin superfamily)